MSWKRKLLKNLFILLSLGTILSAFFHRFVLVFVPTVSMEDTIPKGSLVLGSRSIGEIEQGDIVIFHFKNTLYIKRVVGIPKDRVTINYYGIKINDEPLTEEYLKEDMIVDQEQSFLIPDDSYFLLGDNRNHSKDARVWKNPYRKKEDIVAVVRIIFSIKPFCFRFP